MTTISVLMLDSETAEVEVKIPAVWVICDACSGRGTSSSYLGAFTRDDLDEEGPEFVEEYMAGNYDRPCGECHGSGKLLEPDRERIEAGDSDEQKAALEQMDRDARDDAEMRYTNMRESGHFDGGY